MDLERGLRAVEVLQRDVLLVGVRIVQHRVAVAERAALGILPGQPDRRPFAKQRGERQRLGQAPIDFAFELQRRLALGELRG